MTFCVGYARCLAGKVCSLVRSTWGTSLGGDKLGARAWILNTKVARRACTGRAPGNHSPCASPQQLILRFVFCLRNLSSNLSSAPGINRNSFALPRAPTHLQCASQQHRTRTMRNNKHTSAMRLVALMAPRPEFDHSRLYLIRTPSLRAWHFPAALDGVSQFRLQRCGLPR